jgi:hypothetical protein
MAEESVQPVSNNVPVSQPEPARPASPPPEPPPEPPPAPQPEAVSYPEQLTGRVINEIV